MKALTYGAGFRTRSAAFYAVSFETKIIFNSYCKLLQCAEFCCASPQKMLHLFQWFFVLRYIYFTHSFARHSRISNVFFDFIHRRTREESGGGIQSEVMSRLSRACFLPRLPRMIWGKSWADYTEQVLSGLYLEYWSPGRTILRLTGLHLIAKWSSRRRRVSL